MFSVVTADDEPLATSTGISGQAGAQLTFIVPAGASYSNVKIIGTEGLLLTATVIAASSGVDGLLNNEAGIVISGKPSEDASDMQILRAEK